MRAVIWLAVSTQAQTADDKISLPEQESAARELAAREGWTIVDVLSVPGYSRRESDVITALEDFAEQGIFAYHSLRQHWANRDFDILIARDHSRFGRSQTLHAYVVENTIVSGARIYLLQGGWIDQTTLRGQLALGGFAATGDIDRLVKARKSAMPKRAERGLPVAHIIISHKIRRDPVSGKALGIEVDQARIPLWEEAARQIISGLSYKDVCDVLFEKGYASNQHHRWPASYIRAIFANPTFWGHIAFRSDGKHGASANRQTLGAWVFGPGHPIPDGITIYYNVHPPALSGPMADALQAELLRRKARANKGAYKVYWASGLILCAECGYYMAIGGRGRSLRCHSKYKADHNRPPCTQSQTISVSYIRHWLDRRLRVALEAQDPSILTPSDAPDLPQRIAASELLLADLENRIRRLIRKQAEADDTVADLYAEQIETLGKQLKSAQAVLASLRVDASHETLNHQQLAYSELVEITIDELWKRPALEINQLLHRLLGDWRIVAQDGKVVGMARANSHDRQGHRKKRLNG